MLISIGKQSGESVESVLKKKKEATVERICAEKEGFKHGMRMRWPINVSSITTVYYDYAVKCFAQLPSNTSNTIRTQTGAGRTPLQRSGF